MILTKKQIESLLTLVEHAHRDICYGPEGTYCKTGSGEDNDFDERSAREANFAIDFIKGMISENYKNKE